MADFSMDDNDIITSFSNPNYTMITDDVLNSNLPSTNYYTDDNSHIYEDVRSPQSTNTQLIPGLDHSTGSTKGRQKYAHMDLTSMGIELPSSNNEKRKNGSLINTPDSVASMESEGQDSAYSCITSPDEKTSEILQVEHNDDDTEDEETEWKPKGFLGYYASLERNSKAAYRESRDKQSQEKENVSNREQNATEHTQNSHNGKDNKARYDDNTKVINSPDSNDSGIQADVQHIRGPINDDIYAVVQKPKHKHKQELPKQEEEDESEEDTPPLAPGWEKHEDEDGPYYWHIKSGTIQRDPPPPAPPERQISSQSDTSETSTECKRKQSESSDDQQDKFVITEPHQEPHLQEFETHAFKYAAESIKSLSKQKEDKHRPRSKDTGEQPIRFAVRSLGWVQIPEEDLTPEKSSKAVNKCIVDLSLGRNDINDVVGRWGDGKDLYMDLDDQSLILIDPQDVSVLNLQPIQSIRVWGVGRDNGRDFAYVARDRVTRKHMCHVFRCDTPARQIANTLRDICQRIMLERSKGLLSDSANTLTNRSLGITRPNKLPVGQPDGQKITFESLFNNTSFPTPMEEPKKVIRCHYLGTAQVIRPTGKTPHGVEVLNGAAEKVYSRVPPEKWMFVSVAIAPSTITITEHGKPDNTLAECRVRFLSFMGIAQKNVKLCSFIMHTAQDQFVAHVFHCEPSAGALCKTIEAACKLRYQKCLDSHQNQMPDANKKSTATQSKSIGASLKQGMQNVFGSLGKSRKSKS